MCEEASLVPGPFQHQRDQQLGPGRWHRRVASIDEEVLVFRKRFSTHTVGIKRGSFTLSMSLSPAFKRPFHLPFLSFFLFFFGIYHGGLERTDCLLHVRSSNPHIQRTHILSSPPHTPLQLQHLTPNIRFPAHQLHKYHTRTKSAQARSLSSHAV